MLYLVDLISNINNLYTTGILLDIFGFVLNLLGIFGEVQKKEVKKGKIIVATDVHTSRMIINSIKYTVWL